MSGEFVRGWSLSLYESAAEAGGAWSSGTTDTPTPGEKRTRCRTCRGRGEPSGSAKLRRYAAANGLNRLGTLTYAGPGCHDQVVFRGHMAEFFRSLRRSWVGSASRMRGVAEWHKSGH